MEPSIQISEERQTVYLWDSSVLICESEAKSVVENPEFEEARNMKCLSKATKSEQNKPKRKTMKAATTRNILARLSKCFDVHNSP